ncbi:ROK family protein [Aquipuribacter hungaricus]|uniref:ROK family protein n=1 Tax=Aquipuribacter hungaricus TaxID=545624 RepID=A0ABV7WEU7_9MICO
MTTTPPGSRSRALRPTGRALPAHARAHNRSLLLQSLVSAGPHSRADLARATGLTRVTVSDVVAALIDDGLVVELGVRPGTRVGKPAELVGVDPDGAHIVAVDLSDDRCVSGAVVDLAGQVRRTVQVPRRGAHGQAAVDLLVATVRDLVGAATAPLLGVGIGTPGIVSGGVVAEAPNLGWTDVALARLVSDAVGLPVHVANDANAAALAEHSHGGAVDRGLLVLTVGLGVGAGLLLDGALLHGPHHAAGEIGHVVVDERGGPCACGRTGCLETVLAVPALRAATEGLPPAAAERALASAGRRLGQALAPIVGVLDLQQVVLAGPAELLGGPLLRATAATVRRRAMPVVAEAVEIRLSALADRGVLLGASVLVLSGELGVT